MATMAENVITAGAKNRPPKLEKGMYDSWKSRILLYIEGKENGEMLIGLIEKGPFQFNNIAVPTTKGFFVPSFLPTNDPIASLNKAMMFLNTAISSRLLPINNQLRTSSNLRTQATIQDGRVIVHNVQG
ncbi:hypothetical protein Tco_0879316 [Tanacetum coccineum]